VDVEGVRDRAAGGEGEMSIKDGIFQMIGKTVKEIITAEGSELYPGYHLFIVFDDGTSYEFYGSGRINSAGDLHTGVESHGGSFNACRTITRYYKDDRMRNRTEELARRTA
jgi:hypothetical protein